jgi:hypothetical protein
MSNYLAVATVTAALAQLVRNAAQSAVPGADVLLGRPEAPAGGAALARARLYLYQVSHNAGLRNADLPGRNAAGDLVKRPTAALNLHYLVSFYGDENTLEPQRMLAAVVRDLHGQPGLTRAMIRNAVASQLELNDSDLADAFEQVKFTALDLSIDEWTKLWSVFFQTTHAPSLAYQASVVLIESVDRAQGGLPVLRRGDQDQGIDALIGPFPSLASVHIGDRLDADRRPRLPSLPAARLGDLLTFAGQNLGGDSVSLIFSNPRLANPIEVSIPAADRTASELRLILPSDAQAGQTWVAGAYAVRAEITRGERKLSSGVIPLAVAPKVTSITPNPAARDVNGDIVLTVACTPQVSPKQPVALAFADREVAAVARIAATDPLTFAVIGAPILSRATIARLRVDGVESLPFVRLDKPPRYDFDEAQKVTIT